MPLELTPLLDLTPLDEEEDRPLERESADFAEPEIPRPTFTMFGKEYPIPDQANRPPMPRAVSDFAGLPPETSRVQDLKEALPGPGEFTKRVMEPTGIEGAGQGVTALMTTTPEELKAQMAEAPEFRRMGEQLGAIQRPEVTPFAASDKPTTGAMTPIGEMGGRLAEPPEIPESMIFDTALRNELAKGVEELTTGENQAIMVGTMGAGSIPKIGQWLQRAVSGYFGYEGARAVQDAAKQLREATTPEGKAQAWAGIIKGAAIAVPATLHAVRPPPLPHPAIPPQFIETMRRVDAVVPDALPRAKEAAIKKVSEAADRPIEVEAKVEPVGERPGGTPPREAPPAPADTLAADVARERAIAAEKKALLDSEDIMTLGENPKWMELSKEFEDIKNRYQGRKPSDVVAEQPKAVAAEPPGAEKFEVSVQAEDPAYPGTGFVQIVDTAVKSEKVKSPTVESLRAAGVDVPDFSKLPTGKYTWKEAIEKARATEAPEAATPAAPNQTSIQAGRAPVVEPGVGAVPENVSGAGAETVRPNAQPLPKAVADTIETQPVDVQSGAPVEPQPAVAEPIGQGAGGAMRAGEMEPPKPFKTSNKNATVDAERKARGLQPMMDLERRSNQSAWDEAMRKIDERPEVQDRLITELGKTPRALTPEENAMVTHRRIDLRNEYEKALNRWKEAFESDDMVRASEESASVKQWSDKLADLEDITKATGAESGRSLQARKMMANEDFSLAAMELRAREAKGKNLSPEEHIELIKAQEHIADLQRKIDSLEQGREGKEVETQTAETMKEVEREAKTKPKDPAAASEETITGRIKAKFEKGEQNAITPLVQQLARMLWQRGVRGQKLMIDRLHEILKTIDPEFTRDQTQRAFSGYGDFTPLSKAEIDVGLRDLKGQTQQVLKIEALEARKPLEKTGQERRTPSDEERRLIKQVNELKRKYGVVVTDPATQLKSALQSRKTYYEHRIADLKHEIETRQRIVKTKSSSPTDAELDLMIAEKDRLQSEHDSIFPKREMTDEQRLKQAIAAADRNLAQWEVRLTNAEKGVFDSRVPGRKVTSSELELIQAEAAAIREHVKELHDLDAAVVEQKRTASLESQKATLEKQIAEQERKLREGDLEAPGQRQNRPADPLLEALMQKRDTLNKQLAEARKKPEAQKYAEAQQRQLDKLNKSIDERLAKVAAGDISPIGSPKKVNRPMSPELERARQQLEAVNSQLADLRKQAKPVKTPEEIALQSLKTRMTSQAVDFRKRLAEGDFTKRERKPVTLDAEANRLKAERDLAKEEFQAGLEKDRWDKSTLFEKGKAHTGGVYDLLKTLMATGEFSFALRQGKGAFLEAIFSPKRAVIFAKSFRDGLRAMKSPLEQRTVENAIFNDPMYSQAVRDKLYVPEHGSKLSKQEEFMIGRYSDAVPGVAAFNRAGETFLKKLRFDNYKLMSKAMTESGTPTPAEGKIIAAFINEQTGRGGLGKAEPAAMVLNRVLFSPRYLMSRLQLASGHQLWAGPWKGTGRARKAVAASYARMLVGAAAYYTALHGFFNRDDKEGAIETDFRSSDAGKLKMGDTRLDPMAGIAQIATMGTRTATGEAKDSTGETFPIVGEDARFGKDWVTYAVRFARSKLHPAIGGAIDLRMGENMVGDPATIGSKLTESGPMTYYDIYEALRAQDLSDGAALALLGLLGEGIQTYKPK